MESKSITVNIEKHDTVRLDVREKVLVVGKVFGKEDIVSMNTYYLDSLDDSLNMYDFLRDSKKSGTLKNVTII